MAEATTVPLDATAGSPRRRRRLLGWPMRPIAVIGPAVVIFVVALASTWGMTRWRYPQWVQTSAAMHEQLLLTAPIAAAAACYCAASLCGPRSLLALPGSARTGWRSVTRQCAALAVWFVTAYLLAFVPLLLDTARRASSDGPDLLAMASGPVGLAAFVALGYVLGTVVPTPIVAPGAAVLAFVLLQLRPAGVGGLVVGMPVQGYGMRTGVIEDPGLALYRLLFLVVLAAALLLTAGAVLRRRHRPLAARAGAGAVLVVPLAMMAATALTGPTSVVPEPSPPAVCETSAGVRICVHEAYRDDLPAVRAITDRIVDASGGPAGFRSVVDSSLVDSSGYPPPDSAWVQLSPVREPGTSVPGDIARAVTGDGACSRVPGRNGVVTGIDAERERYSAQLAEWVLTQAGYPATARPRVSDEPGSVGVELPPLVPFAGFAPAEVRRWLVEQRAELVACTLPGELIR